VALDPQVRAVLEQGADAPEVWQQPLAQARHDHEATTALSGPAEAVDEVRDLILADHVTGRLYRPVDHDGGTIVYLHGGGWVVGSLFSFDPLCRALANAARASVVSVAYRLAPESPFPAAVEDARAAVRWVADHAEELGAEPARLALAGDSAGGNLVAVAARHGDVPVRAQALIYPVTDGARDTPSYGEYAEGYGLTAREMAWYWRRYLDGRDPADPDASPLRAPDLAGQPPAFVLTAEYDVLRDEAEAYARRLQEAGVEVTAKRWPGVTHGFFRWLGEVDAARAAVDEVGGWLTKKLEAL